MIQQRWQVKPKGFWAYIPSLPKLPSWSQLLRFVVFVKTHAFPCICRLPKKERSRENGTKPQNFNYSFELQIRVSQSLRKLQDREITVNFVTMPGIVLGRPTEAGRGYVNSGRHFLNHSQSRKPELACHHLPLTTNTERGVVYKTVSFRWHILYIP